MACFSFIAPAYKYFPVLLPSLMSQTFRDWECICIHDSPNEQYTRWVEDFGDPRIHLMFSKTRLGQWGHPLRQRGIDAMSPDSKLCCVTNADNYYTPNFCEAIVSAIGDNIGAYCNLLHSHAGWTLMQSSLEQSWIDCGNFVIRSAIAKEVGWKSMRFAADWDYIADIIARYGRDKIVKLDKILFVHN